MEKTLNKSELLVKLESLKNRIGTDELLEELALALTSKELQENLEFIDSMFDTNVF